MSKSACSAIAAMLFALIPAIARGYDIDLGPFGHACDTCGGGVIGGLPGNAGGPIVEGTAQANGLALEEWIRDSHGTAQNGAQPIPDIIRLQLTGYASEDSMNRVRYKVGDNGFINLAGVLEKGGLARAVTLVDVIVFHSQEDVADPALWAHELTHVDQYRDWGVRDFAIRYARNYNGVEDPAYAKQNGYPAWFQQHAQAGGVTVQPPQLGAFCYVGGGRYGPGPLQPIGSSCFIGTPSGPMYGSIGQ